MAIFGLHFSTLTITSRPLESDSPAHENSRFPRFFFRAKMLLEWISYGYPWSGQTRIRKIVYEWPSNPQHAASEWHAIIKNHRWMTRSKTWKAELRLVPGDDGNDQRVDAVTLTMR